MAITKTEIDILLKARADLVGLKTARGELGGLQREIKETNASFKSLAGTGANLLGSLGLGISAGALLSGIKQVIDYGSKITDLATQTRTSTDEFQALAIAAQDAGVEQQQLANTLIYLQKSVSETATGTGEAVQAFKALNLNARELSQLSVAKQFEAVAKAVANAEDKTTAYSFALDILGARNAPRLQEVLNILGESGDAMGRLVESTKNLRLTPEQLRTLDDAGDKLARIATELKVLGATGVVRIAVLMRVKQEGESDLDRFIAYLSDTANIGKDLLLAANPSLKLLVKSVEAITEQADGAASATEELADSTNDSATAGEKLLTIAEKEKLEREAILAVAKELAATEKFVTNYIAERQKILDAEYKRTVSLNEEAAKLGQEQAEAALDALPTLERHKVLQERLNELNKEAVSLRGQDDNDTFAKRLQIQKAIEKTTKDIAKINEGLTGSLDAFFDNIDGASTTMDVLRKKTEKTKNIADELGLTFSSAFEDAIVEGKKFSEVLKGLAQDILRIIVRKSITEPIASGISGFFDGIFKRAAGGPVAAGTAYMVGEKGPELFVPGFSGTIVPNHQVNAMAASGDGGDTFNFNYSFTGGVTRGEMADIIPQIVEASKAAVLDAKRRRQPGFA